MDYVELMDTLAMEAQKYEYSKVESFLNAKIWMSQYGPFFPEYCDFTGECYKGDCLELQLTAFKHLACDLPDSCKIYRVSGLEDQYFNNVKSIHQFLLVKNSDCARTEGPNLQKIIFDPSFKFIGDIWKESVKYQMVHLLKKPPKATKKEGLDLIDNMSAYFPLEVIEDRLVYFTPHYNGRTLSIQIATQKRMTSKILHPEKDRKFEPILERSKTLQKVMEKAEELTKAIEKARRQF